LHAFLQPDAGLPAEHGAGFADVSDVAEDIRGMDGGVDAVGFFAEQLLDQLYDGVDAHHFVSTQVEDFVTDIVQRQQGAGGNIVHIGEPARLLATAIDAHGSALRDPLAKAEHGHIRSTGGTVDGEIAHDAGIDAVEVMIGIGEGFGALFAGGVGSQGTIGGIELGVRRGAIGSVEAGGGGEDELGHFLPAGVFQHVERAERVGVEIAPGVGHALAHASHGSQVDDCLGMRNGLGEMVDDRLVGDIGFQEGEGGLRKQRLKAMFLHTYVVGSREVIDAKNLVPLREKGIGNFGTDETSRAGDDIGAHQSLITFKPALGTSLVALRASKTSRALSTTIW